MACRDIQLKFYITIFEFPAHFSIEQLVETFVVYSNIFKNIESNHYQIKLDTSQLWSLDTPKNGKASMSYPYSTSIHVQYFPIYI